MRRHADRLGEIILCGSSAYTKKYYLNPDFEDLPESIKDDLKIMTLLFDSEGRLQFQTGADEGDLLYDDIGSVLKVKQLQRTRQELLESLELYYKVFFLGEEISPEDVEE